MASKPKTTQALQAESIGSLIQHRSSLLRELDGIVHSIEYARMTASHTEQVAVVAIDGGNPLPDYNMQRIAEFDPKAFVESIKRHQFLKKALAKVNDDLKAHGVSL